jgi:hypothetical protein
MSDDDTPTGRTKPIPRRLRFEILRRDNYTCRYCGASAPDVELTVDHVIPRVLGGPTEPSNLVTACAGCNAGKASTSPDTNVVEDVAADALRWAGAAERAAAIRRAELRDEDAADNQFLDAWCKIFADSGYLPLGWDRTIRTFRNRGLDLNDFQRFIYATGSGPATLRQCFRYFCGCCWREISARDEIARQLIEDGEP